MSCNPIAGLALGLALASLGACASSEELRQEDEAACISFGFHPGTNDFAACLQRESLARRYALNPPYAAWGPGPLWGPAHSYYWFPP